MNTPALIRDALLKTPRLTEEDLYLIDGPLNPTRLMALYEGDHSPELRDPPFVAPVGAALRGHSDVFAPIRERDTLFNLLTGISQFQEMHKLLVAPFDLYQRLNPPSSRRSAAPYFSLSRRIFLGSETPRSRRVATV